MIEIKDVLNAQTAMEYRIRNCGHGGYTVEKGIKHSGGEHIPGMLGVTMPAFIVYESAHFDTEKQALAYIRRKQMSSKRK